MKVEQQGVLVTQSPPEAPKAPKPMPPILQKNLRQLTNALKEMPSPYPMSPVIHTLTQPTALKPQSPVSPSQHTK